MVNQDLLTVFVALTAVAVLIQVGILTGLFFVSNKLSQQADRAMKTARDLTDPVYKLAENLQGMSTRIAELSGVTRGELRELDHRLQNQKLGSD